MQTLQFGYICSPVGEVGFGGGGSKNHKSKNHKSICIARTPVVN